jgi:hypothetical protein
MYNDEEPEGPDYIFGDTAPVPDDFMPTADRPKRYRTFKRVKDNATMTKVCRSIAKATDRAANPLPFGTAADLPKKPEWGSHTYTEIPDEDGPRRHPVFGINPDIVHDDESSPERDAESRLPIENLVSYSQEDLDSVSGMSDDIAKEIQELMLNEGAALLMSYDDASSYTEAVLKDGLGVNVEIDSSVSEVISHMMRLNMITAYMGKLSMPENIKAKFMRTLTEKIAEDAHTAMNKTLNSEKYSSILNNLKARANKGDSGSTLGKDDIAGHLGVVRRRSNAGKGLGAPASENVNDQHDFNEKQNAGVRKE